MVQVVITTPEMLVADDANELEAVNWEVLVVDEAHRLKNHNSKLAVTLRKGCFKFHHKILLTGTPIQVRDRVLENSASKFESHFSSNYLHDDNRMT